MRSPVADSAKQAESPVLYVMGLAKIFLFMFLSIHNKLLAQ
jgi:hypothetical protein